MVAWIRFMPMALKHLTNPVVFWTRRRVAASPIFADKIFIPLFRGLNNTALRIRIAVTINKDSKAKLLQEEKKTLSDGEIINVGADIVGQLVAILIGVLIIEACDKLSKSNQEKQHLQTANQLREYECKLEKLTEKLDLNSDRVSLLEDQVADLLASNTSLQQKLVSENNNKEQA